MRHEEDFMQTFKGYVKWNEELQENALHRLMSEYISDYDDIISTTSEEDFRFITRLEIEKDIRYYEKTEQYEICRILKDLQDYL
tara:strand:+ start:557 stop:808 length:252 start_codon:yes stop_codon:yes gene_type:complete